MVSRAGPNRTLAKAMRLFVSYLATVALGAFVFWLLSLVAKAIYPPLAPFVFWSLTVAWAALGVIYWLQRIDALKGRGRRAAFIREAVEAELARQEAGKS